MLHLAELHGAATHLAVVAIPVFVILLACRRAGVGGTAVIQAEPWALGAAVAGVAAAGLTGLLVWGQAQTELRGQAFRVGNAHFWLGIVTAAIVVAAAALHWHVRRREPWRHPKGLAVLAGAALVAVVAQGYLGGRMTYNQGVGVFDGGQFTQSGVGSTELNIALAQNRDEVLAGREAFSAEGLGCARCHGDRAQGTRGPALAGGRDLADFRRVHGHGLFPPQLVSDRDFAAIDAWLKSLKPAGEGADGG